MITTDRLELNIVRHCNNSCALCNHGSPVALPYTMPLAVARSDLAALGRIVRTGVCCLQGGEPLLHPYLEEMISVMVESKIADENHILSNGTLLERMPDSFWQRLARNKIVLRLTLYPNGKWERGVACAQKRSAELGIDLRLYPTDSFFRVLRPTLVDGMSMFKDCGWNQCHTVHEGWFYHCPLTCFFPAQFLGWDEHVDGIELAGITEERMSDFLSRRRRRPCGRA